MHRSKPVVVVSPGGRGGVACAVEAVLPHLPRFEHVRVGRSPGDPLGWGALARARAAARRADVIHLHPSFRIRALVRDLSQVPVARRAAAGIVVHLHGFDERLLGLGDRSGTARGAVLGALAGTVVRTASEAHAERLRRWGVDAVAVPNAVALEALPDERRPEPDLVLFLGRLVRGKGLEELVDAARRRRFRLVIAGEGPLREALASEATDNVTFEGWVPPARRRELLARAALLVHPSASEAFPLAVAEALASGVPVVARATGDVPSLVGGAGRILHDPRDLAAAVERALDDPPDTGEARRRIRERCAPAAVAARWTELHERARRSR